MQRYEKFFIQKKFCHFEPFSYFCIFKYNIYMDTIIILDFGSQYTQLIARKIREQHVYCEIHPFNKIPTLTPEVKGVVFSGSPFSCNAPDAPVPYMTNIKGKLNLLAV